MTHNVTMIGFVLDFIISFIYKIPPLVISAVDIYFVSWLSFFKSFLDRDSFLIVNFLFSLEKWVRKVSYF